MKPIVARLGPVSYDNSRGTPISTMVIQFSGNSSRIWNLTASYSSTSTQIQLKQVLRLLEEVPTISDEDPGVFDGRVIVEGLEPLSYDLLSGRVYDYDYQNLVSSCKDLINRHSVTLGISTQ